MNDFNLWFITGIEHIADLQGYDHILFLLALCGVYEIKQWKNVLVLITAFTIGHSITLALSVTNAFSINSAIIEFLIPITIILTASYNLYTNYKNKQNNPTINYGAAVFFGFIHGMGFSYLLKSLLGKTESILSPLFAFNVGLEAGQIIIVASILIISLFLTSVLKINPKLKNNFISLAVLIIASIMAFERLPALTN
ncbi:MAG: HupE/UreJ family protein [Bacteroidetes bacterium]|nr:HupE/UreJ family protein [Bacteroidota bacterium]